METAEDIFKRYGLKTVQLKDGLYIVTNWKDIVIDVDDFCYEFDVCCVCVTKYFKGENKHMQANVLTIWLEDYDDDVQLRINDKLGTSIEDALGVFGRDKKSERDRNALAIDTLDLVREVHYNE